MFLELKDLEFSNGRYSIDLGMSLIEVSETNTAWGLGWRAQATFKATLHPSEFWVESDTAECALNELISLISDFQEDGDEIALEIKITT